MNGPESTPASPSSQPPRRASISIPQLFLALAIAGIGVYLFATKQGISMPVFLIGVGLAFAPFRIVSILGALTCIGAGAYWLYLNGQAGILQGGLFIICGGFFLVERLRPR